MIKEDYGGRIVEWEVGSILETGVGLYTHAASQPPIQRTEDKGGWNKGGGTAGGWKRGVYQNVIGKL